MSPEALLRNNVSAYIRDMVAELSAMAQKNGDPALAKALERVLEAERLRMH